MASMELDRLYVILTARRLMANPAVAETKGRMRELSDGKIPRLHGALLASGQTTPKPRAKR